MTIDIFSIITAIIIPLFAIYARVAKTKHDETNKALSEQNKLTEHMINVLNSQTELLNSIKDALTRTHNEHVQAATALAVMSEKVDATERSVGDIHRRMDR